MFVATDDELRVRVEVTFQSSFYPKNKKMSIVPGYRIDIRVTDLGAESAEIFVALPLDNPLEIDAGFQSRTPIVFPDGIDHSEIDSLYFEQVLCGDSADTAINQSYATLRKTITCESHSTTHSFYHVGYIAEPTLRVNDDYRRFAYTEFWENAEAVARWMQTNKVEIDERCWFFEESTSHRTLPSQDTFPDELKLLMSTAFKGLAANAWWAEDGWFSVMEIGAYHSTLDVDYQLCIFFFQYWPELVRPMLDQWADFYIPQSGYMAHDVGQHLEATGNRYGGPGSAMKVEENCNYILLLHHYWRWTADHSVIDAHFDLIRELVEFLFASDTTGSGLPNKFCDNTNDWGSGLITASEEQSYHGVRMVAAFSAVAQMARHVGNSALAERVEAQAQLIAATLESGWLGDHYPISLSSPDSFNHYSMWTTHGLLYPLRSGLNTPLDLDKLRIDIINSTARTMREHGSVHSTADVRGWQAQNLWRDCIAAYLGLDYTHHLQRYLGHGEYVSYEDTTILEVANELMVVPGAVAEHVQAGQTHDFPMVDGHPRPACVFGLAYALAGIQFDAIDKVIRVDPVVFPQTVLLTHLTEWDAVRPRVVAVQCKRSTPNQDQGWVSAEIEAKFIYSTDLLDGYTIEGATIE